MIEQVVYRGRIITITRCISEVGRIKKMKEDFWEGRSVILENGELWEYDGIRHWWVKL